MANAPWHPLGDYGLIEMRAGGSSPTCTHLSFQKRDTTKWCHRRNGRKRVCWYMVGYNLHHG